MRAGAGGSAGTVARAGTLAVVLALACAGAPPRSLVAPRELPEARGAPRVEAVIDLGGIDVPVRGRLPEGDSDGKVAVGETLWIRGTRFGRLPTVRIAGHPALLLGRTADGGIVVRVPPGTPAGRQELEVSHRHGRASVEVRVLRHGVVVSGAGTTLAWLALEPEGARPAGEGALAPVAHLAASADGRAAYLVGEAGGTLDVLDLARGGPGAAPVFRLELGSGGNHALVAAARAPVLALVRERQVALWSTESALRPARRTPVGLPIGLTGPEAMAVALSPDGTLLAVARRDADRVELLRVDRVERGRLPRVAVIDLDSGGPGPGLVALCFSAGGSGRAAGLAGEAGGDLLWVLSGERPDNAALGPRPARVHAVRLSRGPDGEVTPRPARAVELPRAAAPRALALTSHPLASGAAIRLPPEEVAALVAAQVRGERGDALFLVGLPGAPGAGTAPGAGGVAQELVVVPGEAGALAADPEGRWGLAAFVGEAGTPRLVQVRIDGRAQPPREFELPAGPPGGAAAVAPPRGLFVQP